MAEVTTLIENEFAPGIRNLFREVKKSLYAMIYIAKPNLKRSHDDVKVILDDIISLSKKNIEIKILFNSIEIGNLASLADKISYKYLRDASVTVKATKKGRMTHCKFFLLDDNITILGSHNLTENSFHRNREVSLIVKDETTCAKLKEYFLKNFYEAEK